MSKEKLKTEPRGVRLDIVKLAFVQEKEGLPTVQKVVDFLLDAYWWAAKAGKKPRRKKVALKKEEAGEFKMEAPELSFPSMKVQNMIDMAGLGIWPAIDATKKIPPAPVREDFEDNWRYLEAKAIWKEKYGK